MKKNNILNKVSNRTKKLVFWTSVSVAVIGNFLYTKVMNKKENNENAETSS